MLFGKVCSCLTVVLIAATSVCEAEQRMPSGGTRVIEAEFLSPQKLNFNSSRAELGSKSFLQSATADGASSIKVDITGQPQNTWDISVHQTSSAKVSKNDALVASFWLRGKAKSGQAGAVTEFVFERAGAPYTKSVQYLIETPIDGSWQQYWVAFKSVEDYAAAGSTLTFQLGYIKQEIEIAKIELLNFGQRPLDGLPHTPLSYVGRSEDAQWRKDALERIEKIRKADLKIKLIDSDGNPLANQPVRVKLDRHAFGFGTAANAWKVTGQDEDSQKYREVLKENFNLVAVENGLKWPLWDAEPELRKRTIETLHWLKDNNFQVRGHVMVWPGQGNLPGWVRSLKDNPQALKAAVGSRIREMGYVTQDFVRGWDVVNEGFDNHELMDWLGEESMIDWFKQADAVLPDCNLYYNDYAALVRGGHPTTHKDHFEKTIRNLIDNGAPLDGIGIQGHFGSLLTPPHRILQELDRWGSFQKKIMITEFDVIVPDEQLRADFLRDFFISCFSHEAVEGIVSWGFWSETHWMPKSAYFDKQWKLTKLGRQWNELMQMWETDETLKTDSEGTVELRGFIGDYKVDVDGKAYDVVLSQSGNEVKLSIQ